MENSTYGFIGYSLLAICIGLAILLIASEVTADYEYTNKYLSYWNLADKSSTITAKSDYITQFVNKLNESRTEFADNNAVYLKTIDNSFNYNFLALVSLRDRLQTISKMNESDFAYQTAIQQITEQEQGQAHSMLYVFSGTWYLKVHPFLWGWHEGISIGIWIIVLLISIVLIMLYHME